MPAYALLIRPASNRVFGGVAGALAASELAAANELLLHGRLFDVERSTIAGVEYLTVRTDGPLDASATLASVVANLSSSYALFERMDGADEMLRPVALTGLDLYDDDLVSTQRYLGKTNETLTKLAVNLGLFASTNGFDALLGGRRVQILDPLCGRGTTLNQALMYGADAFGIEQNAKDTTAYATFLTTWLQTKRLKHRIEKARTRNRFAVSIGGKGASSAGSRQVVDLATADTTEALDLFGRNSMDLIVTDLPYGVQHGSKSDAGLARGPSALLEAALPVWRTVVRPGGAVVLSWNVRVLPRPQLLALLDDAGLAVVALGGGIGFEHRVDRTITRDLVVARRPPT